MSLEIKSDYKIIRNITHVVISLDMTREYFFILKTCSLLEFTRNNYNSTRDLERFNVLVFFLTSSRFFAYYFKLYRLKAE